MYHYVRDAEGSEFPGIKALSIDKFRGQLAYAQKYYSVISMETLLRALSRPEDLPERACLLTFDDGLKDHVKNVLPILKEMKLPGVFFIPARPITEGKILDVQKIQHILAGFPDAAALASDVCRLIEENRAEYNLAGADFYKQKSTDVDRFDSKEIVFVKRVLQRELPFIARRFIVGRLFSKYVAQSEESLFRELYMDTSDIAQLQNAGMFIGSHGFEHEWLGTLDKREQEREIDLALKFLGQIGVDTREWVMGYPYGSYNESLLEALRNRGCVAGFTTRVDIADLEKDGPLVLPRLDTNDLPTSALTAENEWTKRA